MAAQALMQIFLSILQPQNGMDSGSLDENYTCRVARLEVAAWGGGGAGGGMGAASTTAIAGPLGDPLAVGVEPPGEAAGSACWLVLSVRL